MAKSVNPIPTQGLIYPYVKHSNMTCESNRINREFDSARQQNDLIWIEVI